MTINTPPATAPANRSLPRSSGPRLVAITLGAVSIILALVVSGYAAMACALVAIAVGMTGPRRTLPVSLGAAGLLLGFLAQLMRAAVDRGWVG